jgi:hypothetical protein
LLLSHDSSSPPVRRRLASDEVSRADASISSRRRYFAVTRADAEAISDTSCLAESQGICVTQVFSNIERSVFKKTKQLARPLEPSLQNFFSEDATIDGFLAIVKVKISRDENL